MGERVPADVLYLPFEVQQRVFFVGEVPSAVRLDQAESFALAEAKIT